ncbi:hypothetical protein B0H12DRAFT_1232681 [Mycena haematopus]|nr:hypothetical protein B0H12DRAFT_1232681 [Mycena haematopus]
MPNISVHADLCIWAATMKFLIPVMTATLLVVHILPDLFLFDSAGTHPSRAACGT